MLAWEKSSMSRNVWGYLLPLTEAPGVVIGQSEATVLEMTGAYAAIANDGIWNKPHAINRVLDR